MQGVVNNSGHDSEDGVQARLVSSYRRAGKTRPAEVVHVTFNNTNYVMQLQYRTTPKGLSSH